MEENTNTAPADTATALPVDSAAAAAVEGEDIFDTFATDPIKESEGTWTNVGKGRHKVARSNSRAYQKMVAKLVEENSVVLDRNDAAAEACSDELMVTVIANTILMDFDNFVYRGKPITYSKENAKILLRHKDYRRRVMADADTFENYKAEREVAQGNG